ncbi:bifunctional 2-polyprenyl-6-hydroxyphenol methylase/3-demethylubiquinol 3-O-methyltransferase UbiG [Paenibacillus sp. PAMC21692]|uniref:class I SAM-dependent methyltransferase n=1 Tax=Paenibacillus sp. PAMC21692 TaxID=2762320 RepID=UPI00164D623B|nr:class I SAM-dependent methyltransferase [Paenibacillus sp. PAMC21692]QNK58720.1 class I SAM-dependent methyltransferase [Paenibacillus sp. PAMC21692]
MSGKAIYWNHNTAFHAELVNDAKRRGGRVLDIGCGEGLLLERLAPHVALAVGIDPDNDAVGRARKRLGAGSNTELIAGDFMAMSVPPPEERYQTITCVATLHHMELRPALLHMRRFLAPGGRLLVVGLSANKTATDYIVAGLHMMPIKLMDKLQGGMQEIGVKLAEPRESLDEIKRTASEVLPGAKAKRRFYYRYTLTWVNI